MNLCLDAVTTRTHMETNESIYHRKGHTLLEELRRPRKQTGRYYEGESISNQPNLFPVEIHLFTFQCNCPLV